MDPIKVACLSLREQETLSVDAHVVELPIYQDYLPISKTECFAVDKTLDHLKLLNDQQLTQTFLVINLIQITLKDDLFQWILSPLLWS